MSWWAYFPLPTGLVIFLLYNIKTKAYSQYIYRHRNFFTRNPGNTPTACGQEQWYEHG
jgi:hypothetical protein